MSQYGGNQGALSQGQGQGQAPAQSQPQTQPQGQSAPAQGQAQPTDQAQGQAASPADAIALHQHLAQDFARAATITDPNQLAAFKQSMHQKYDPIVGAQAVEQELSSERNPSDYFAKAQVHAKEAEQISAQQSQGGAAAPAGSQTGGPNVANQTGTQPQPAAPTDSNNIIAAGQQAVQAGRAVSANAPQLDPDEKLWNGLTRRQATALQSPQAAMMASVINKTLGYDLAPVLKAGADALDPDKSAATTREQGQATNENALAKSTADMFLPKVDTIKTANGSDVYTTSDADKIAKLSAPGADKIYGTDTIKKGLADAGLKVEMVHYYDPTTGADLGERPVTVAQKIAEANGSNSQGADVADRNNNPGNVKALPSGKMYTGQVGTDPNGFAIFSDRPSGQAAMDRTILQRQTLHGLNTMDGIIADPKYGYDPNNHAYAAQVAAALGIKPTDQVDLSDPTIRQKMMAVMTKVEGGPNSIAAQSQGGQPQGGQARMGTGSAAQIAYNNAQTQNYNTNLKTAQDNIQTYPNKINVGYQIKGLASQVGAGPTADYQKKIAVALSPLIPAAAEHASNAQQLEGDLATGYKNVMSSGVRNEREFNAVTAPLPGITSQPQRLQFYGAGIAASELLNQAKDQARIQYDNTHPNKSENGFQQYWQAQPAYQKGIFGITDPTTGKSPWSGVTLGTANGKPVPFVQLDPKTGKYIVGAGLGVNNHQEFQEF